MQLTKMKDIYITSLFIKCKNKDFAILKNLSAYYFSKFYTQEVVKPKLSLLVTKNASDILHGILERTTHQLCSERYISEIMVKYINLSIILNTLLLLAC